MKKLQLFFFALVHFISVIKSEDCKTAECREFVRSLKNRINTREDPCDDFYEYACGGQDQGISRASKKHLSISEILEKQKTGKLTEIFSDADSSGATETFRKKVTKMYQNCMDLDSIEDNGADIILSELEKTGGWPVMSSKGNSLKSETVPEILAYYTKILQLPIFYAIYVAPDADNSSVNYLNIDALFVPFKFHLPADEDSPEVGQNAYYISEIVKILAEESGINPSMEKVENEIKNMMNFEAKLIELMPAMAARKDVRRRRNLMTVDDFQKFYDSHSQTKNSKITWLSFLGTLLNDTGVVIGPNDVLMVPEVEYIAEVIRLLDKTPIRTIVNYIQWRFVEKMLSAAPEKFRNIALKMSQIGDFLEEPERDAICRELVGLKYAIDYEYVSRNFPKKSKKLANEVISAISKASESILEETSWLKNEEKEFLHEKLRSIERFVGYSDWFDEPSAIDNYYEGCEISDNFMENIIEVERFEVNKSLSQLSRTDRNRFSVDSLATNTLYIEDFNLIAFPAAMLQKPIFSAQYPRVLQYAAFGNIVGRMISQKLENYESANEYINLMSNDTKSSIESKTKCFIDQYNNYKIYETTDETLYVDGADSKSSNIADLSGLKFAYRAYESLKASEKDDHSLPGFDSFTDAQLFFLAFANHQCSDSPPLSKNLAKWNPRPSKKQKIIGALSNMEEFSAAFKCPVTAKMNPLKKCGIWGKD